MFEHKMTILVRDINDNNSDLAIMNAAIVERSDEWDEYIETGRIDGRPIFMGPGDNGWDKYECLVKDSVVADYMIAAYQELNTRFSQPVFIIELGPNN